MDGFAIAEASALRYRSSMQKADAETLAGAIDGALAALQLAAAGDDALPVQAVMAGLQTWRAGFEDAARVMQVRAARIISWTADEGETDGRAFERIALRE